MEPDWIWGLGGGLLIGLGGAVLLWGNGRIMGASGILGGLVDGTGRHDWLERLAFLAGTFLMPLVLYPLFTKVDTHISQSAVVLVVVDEFGEVLLATWGPRFIVRLLARLLQCTSDACASLPGTVGTWPFET